MGLWVVAAWNIIKRLKKELCMNAKIQRNKHAGKNWKNKLKRRKLEQKGQMAANVEEKDQMVPNVNEVGREFEQGPDDVDLISSIWNRRRQYLLKDTLTCC
ncbi:hypothetical protein MKW98_020571 [Papaver atlanticum]|uniref:Uncharacterized protein n=1 Tax=Papaver atlanticum TaxID=357466 RepID=A0AAD4T270_9MAGN|nr:hypothetical protein MKW98_020571 [Papaver atlanticum]